MAKTIIEYLQNEMNKNGYISEKAIDEISKKTGAPKSEIYGTASFYAQFKFTPRAKYTIKVCTGTACFILGGQTVLDVLKNKLGVKEFENTPDNKFCIETVRCLGCCGIAPVITINDEVYGNLSAHDIDKILSSLE